MRELSVYIDYEFLTVDWTIKGFEMFRLVDYFSESELFPKCMHRIRLKEEYIWNSQKEKADLSDDYLRDTLEINCADEPWDSPSITNEFLEALFDRYDKYCIGEALVENYKADSVMPQFVPERLHPMFQNCIRLYKENK